LWKATLWVLSKYPPLLYKRGCGQSAGQSCPNPFPKSRSRTMPQKGTFHTTMMDKVRVAFCQYKRDNPQLSQKDLIKWLEDNQSIKVSQATISTTLKQSAKILAKLDNETNLNAKRQRTVRYSEMESALVKWFRANQEWANVSGELVKESATKIIDRLYPGHEPFEFSSGWLEAFKSHHGIRSGLIISGICHFLSFLI